MAALDFPASPTLNQTYPAPAVPGVPVYTWDGEKWTTTGGAVGSTGAADDPPLMDGTASVGSSTQWAREDHRHPSDTAKASVSYVDTQDALGVRYDVTQSLTAAQQQKARSNIYAAPFDALAYNGVQINGGMEVSQERGTTSTSGNGAYICDGFKQSFAGTMSIASLQAATSGSFPGFPNCLALLVATAQVSIGANDYVIIMQPIEGYRTARLAWGTANAQPITLGFWSSHHRAGVYGGSVRNGAVNRSYAFTYTHNVADTPQYNSITIPGDTAGTWAIDNTTGILLTFAVAAGSTYIAPSANTWSAGSYQTAPGQINGVAATSDIFRITGVTVLPGNEAPSAARSPFIMRPYDQELATCQRYFQWVPYNMFFYAHLAGETMQWGAEFLTTMRAIPTVSSLVADPETTQSSANSSSGTTTKITRNYVIHNLVAAAVGYVYATGYRCQTDARL